MPTVFGLDVIKNNPYLTFSFTPPRYPHSHDFFEISFCATGHSVNTINGTPIDFQNGTCVILRPQDTHALTDYDPAVYKHIDLYATKQQFNDICNCCHKDLFNRILNEKNPIYFSLSNESFSFLFNQVLMLKEMIDMNNNYFELMHVSIILTILSEWIKSIHYTQRHKPNWLKNLLPKFNDIVFLQKNITQIAREAGFSLPYFSTQFKKYMGISANKYLTKKRLHLSKDLLANNLELKILNIANMLGFENPSTFSRHFLQEFKITPSEFRVNYISKVQ